MIPKLPFCSSKELLFCRETLENFSCCSWLPSHHQHNLSNYFCISDLPFSYQNFQYDSKTIWSSATQNFLRSLFNLHPAHSWHSFYQCSRVLLMIWLLPHSLPVLIHSLSLSPSLSPSLFLSISIPRRDFILITAFYKALAAFLVWESSLLSTLCQRSFMESAFLRTIDQNFYSDIWLTLFPLLRITPSFFCTCSNGFWRLLLAAVTTWQFFTKPRLLLVTSLLALSKRRLIILECSAVHASILIFNPIHRESDVAF